MGVALNAPSLALLTFKEDHPMSTIKIKITPEELSCLIDKAPLNYPLNVSFGGILITIKDSWEYKKLMELRG